MYIGCYLGLCWLKGEILAVYAWVTFIFGDFDYRRDLVKCTDDLPYEMGEGCDNCPEGYNLCYNGLCGMLALICSEFYSF